MSSTPEAVEVAVSLPSLLSQAAQGQREITVRATSLETAIEALLADYPLLTVHLFDEQRQVREHVHLFWNDQEVRWLQSWDVPASPGDTLTILQAVSGG